MTLTLRITFIFLLIIPSIFGQSTLSSLKAYTETEESWFSNESFTPKTKVLLAIDEDFSLEEIESVESKLISFADELKASKKFDKSPKKQMEFIFSTTHDRFLKKYKEIARFSEAIKTGTYNCVSATSLYVCLMDYLEIPYEIKMTYDHVYAIAYPKTDRIVIEATNPLKGTSKLNEKTLSESVEGLAKMKIISAEEFKNNTASELFDKYLNQATTVSFLGLAAAQYYNDAILLNQENNHYKAFEQAKKAKVLSDFSKFELGEGYFLELVMRNDDFMTLEGLDYLFQFSNFPSANEDAILDAFVNSLNFKVNNSGDVDFIDTAFQHSQIIVANEELKNQMAEKYYLIKGAFIAEYGDEYTAIECFKKAYEYNPKSPQTQLLIALSVLEEIAYDDYYAEDQLKVIDSLVNEYPFLEEHFTFNNEIANMYIEAASDLYFDSEPEEAILYEEAFKYLETRLGKKLKFNQYEHGLMYADKAAYYYRKQEFQQAHKIAKEGLKLYPNHSTLKDRLDIIEPRLNSRFYYEN